MSKSSGNIAEHLNRMLSAEALAALSDRELLDRFAQARDEAAFAAILERHGALVGSICRRIVNDVHLADDVFQATFVVLSRKAGGLRQKHLLGNWLYGVAQRLALRALQQQARQLQRERKAASQRPESASNQHPWDELIQVLHDELQRLPERLRAPLLACYLEGQTQDEAARSLGWNVKMLRRRLEQGREMLRARMTARGATLSAGLFASILAPSAVAMPVDHRQMLFTATLAGVKGEAISQQVSELVAGGIRMLSISKLKTAFFSILVLCGLAATTGLIWQSSTAKDAPHDEKKDADPKPPATAAEAKHDLVGDPLPAGGVVRMGSLRLFHGTTSRPPSIAFNPDGKSLFSSGGMAIRQWDAEDGAELKHLLTKNASDRAQDEEPKLPGDDIWFSAFSGDGKSAVIATRQLRRKKEPEIQVSVWDLANLKKLRSFPLTKPDGKAFLPLWASKSFVLSPDVSRLALIEGTGDLWVWDLKKDQPVPNQVKVKQCQFVLFNPATKHAITTDGQGRNTIWDMDFQKVIAKFGGSGFEPESDRTFWTDRLRGQLYPMAASPDGKLTAFRVFDTSNGPVKVFLRIYETARLEELGRNDADAAAKPPLTPVREWLSDDTYGMTVQFAPDGRSLYVVPQNAAESHVWRWSLDQKEPVRWPARIDESRRAFFVEMAISPDGKTLATCGGDLRIRLWDIATAKEKATSPGHRSSVATIALLPDGKTLRSVGDDGTLRDWDLGTGKQLRELSDRNDPLSNSLLSPNGKWLLTWNHVITQTMGGGRGGNFGQGLGPAMPQETKSKVLIRDAKTGEIQHRLGEKPMSSVAAFAPDGKTFVTFDTGRIQYWDLESGKKKGSAALTADKKAFFQTAQGKLGITVQSGRSLCVIEFPDRQAACWSLDNDVFEERLGQQTGDSLTGVAVSPDGKLIVLGVCSGVDGAGRLVLCELESGRKVRQFEVGVEYPGLLAFSPDGKTLAMSGFKTMLFDVNSGKLRRTLAGHRGTITQMIYSKDGKRLATASNDSTILLWDVANE